MRISHSTGRMSFTPAALLVLLVAAGCHRQPQVPAGIASIERVGRAGANRIVTPVNQILTPAGIQVELAGLRPQVIALSPDGRLLSTSGKTRELIILDAATGSILQRRFQIGGNRNIVKSESFAVRNLKAFAGAA